ncbi:MAG: hypothetical protein JSW07_20780 [bacterium]|nr:MAG: hypothetical protein JSW07_20780 [bacterium]
MKVIKSFTIMFLILTTTTWATDFHAKQPLLITAAGQSQDVTMVKILAQKAGLKFSFDKLAKPDQLKDHATLVLVTGGSTKGLGAANIDKDQELERVNSLIKAAREVKMNIITMHVGGPSRRGKLSDEFNQVSAENADCLIIVKTGDEDHLFSKIAEGKKIPIFLIDKIIEAGDVLKEIFAEKK